MLVILVSFWLLSMPVIESGPVNAYGVHDFHVYMWTCLKKKNTFLLQQYNDIL